MKILDFNIHLPPHPNLLHEVNTTAYDTFSSLSNIKGMLSSLNVSGGNLMILDTEFLTRGFSEQLLQDIKATNLKCTVMIDPRHADAFDLVDKAASLGISGIKFHPYLLNLADHDFLRAVAVANHAGKLGLWTAVCCSYGTLKMYAVSGVRLLIALAEVIKTPIIALHTGGKLALDVMVIALDTSNVFLDTSFSIPYWIGSSVEQDIAFAIRKVGAKRCLFGSDHPYMDLSNSIQQTLDFLKKYQFSDMEIEQIFYKTTEELFYNCHN
ncbi:MAG: amidohydrolase family protein [Moorea sp. SIOASIH]|uniref:amidohydrolase family protein n=1 Tax=Moorena sp. SIOASIH TaxID=2607817 RepID=UPI0013BE3E7A|nr:amidohydrolase family protein [Moorena sp. SIOASIH]NEO35145.1 amidohydrolase family protein [Moorena sp. SIOASIH]